MTSRKRLSHWPVAAIGSEDARGVHVNPLTRHGANLLDDRLGIVGAPTGSADIRTASGEQRHFVRQAYLDQLPAIERHMRPEIDAAWRRARRAVHDEPMRH